MGEDGEEQFHSYGLVNAGSGPTISSMCYCFPICVYIFIYIDSFLLQTSVEETVEKCYHPMERLCSPPQYGEEANEVEMKTGEVTTVSSHLCSLCNKGKVNLDLMKYLIKINCVLSAKRRKANMALMTYSDFKLNCCLSSKR